MVLLAVNLAKVPVYVALSRWTTGGPFFTRTTLAFDAVLFPAVLLGLLSGRRLLHKLPERSFLMVCWCSRPPAPSSC